MPVEQIETTIRALEAALEMDVAGIESLIADGKAIMAKRTVQQPPAAKKRGRPRKGVIQQPE
jgi:hypothetical protein